MVLDLYDEITLERSIRDYFGVDMEIQRMILSNVPVGPTTRASLVLSSNKHLYLHIKAQSKQTLAEVKKIVGHMGLKASGYVPPKNRSNYFDEMALIKFKEVFPGRQKANSSDLMYYRTLVNYNPALVLIDSTIDDKIYQYDSDSNTKWRLATKYNYQRKKVG